jgi:hypothetical protein
MFVYMIIIKNYILSSFFHIIFYHNYLNKLNPTHMKSQTAGRKFFLLYMQRKGCPFGTAFHI